MFERICDRVGVDFYRMKLAGIVHRIYDDINPDGVTSGKNYSFISVARS